MSVEAFFREFAQSLQDETLQRMTLSRPAPREERRSLHLRPVLLQEQRLIQIVHRSERRDVTENVTSVQALEVVRECCGTQFLDAHLELDHARLTLRYSRKGVPHLTRKKTESQSQPLLANDRSKTGILSLETSPWTRDLGLVGHDGKLLPSMSHKWRQIQRYVELLDHAWKDVRWPRENTVHVSDMGAGKGYLTFAVHAWITGHLGMRAEVTGIEQRNDLVDLGNATAQKHACDGLTFQAASIEKLPTFSEGQVNILIALHACDTATDDALAAGIRAKSEMILCAPCCQHQVRAEMRPGEAILGLVEHGLLRQRQAALLTDALRALLLEREGYAVRVVEFVDSDHTDKNLLLIASRTGRPDHTAQKRIEALKELFGLERHYLETALAT